ncbi:MAG: hypothetical protein EZS28_056284, partial [Streblomastix strix]
MVFKEVSEF